jgi:tripartite-type tricarboxylate transporter receptor subunit TctC
LALVGCGDSNWKKASQGATKAGMYADFLFRRGPGREPMTLIRRQFLTLAGAALAAPAVVRPSWSQAYPNRPVRVVVMLAAGGGTDFLARLTGEPVSRGLGQQLVIENRTGAGGTIGIETAAKSPADGYTVLFSNDNIASAPHILKVNGDYQKDLVPVILIARQPLVWAVHSSLKINTVQEFVDAMKKNRGKGYATSGVGSNQHFLGEWFLKEAGVKLDHVPYRGAGQAVNDLIAAHVPIACLGPTSMMPHYEAGTVKFLAQSSETRSATLPNIPTFQEAGFKGLVLDQWFGVFVPAGTPREIIARLNTEFAKSLTEEKVKASMLKAANDPVGGTPEQFATLVRNDSAKYARLAKELGIKGE